jgi:hypothetical protein
MNAKNTLSLYRDFEFVLLAKVLFVIEASDKLTFNYENNHLSYKSIGDCYINYLEKAEILKQIFHYYRT